MSDYGTFIRRQTEHLTGLGITDLIPIRPAFRRRDNPAEVISKAPPKGWNRTSYSVDQLVEIADRVGELGQPGGIGIHPLTCRPVPGSILFVLDRDGDIDLNRFMQAVPATGMIDGRPERGPTHWIYALDPAEPIPAEFLTDPTATGEYGRLTGSGYAWQQHGITGPAKLVWTSTDPEREGAIEFLSVNQQTAIVGSWLSKDGSRTECRCWYDPATGQMIEFPAGPPALVRWSTLITALDDFGGREGLSRQHRDRRLSSTYYAPAGVPGAAAENESDDPFVINEAMRWAAYFAKPATRTQKAGDYSSPIYSTPIMLRQGFGLSMPAVRHIYETVYAPRCDNGSGVPPTAELDHHFTRAMADTRHQLPAGWARDGGWMTPAAKLAKQLDWQREQGAIARRRAEHRDPEALAAYDEQQAEFRRQREDEEQQFRTRRAERLVEDEAAVARGEMFWAVGFFGEWIALPVIPVIPVVPVVPPPSSSPPPPPSSSPGFTGPKMDSGRGFDFAFVNEMDDPPEPEYLINNVWVKGQLLINVGPIKAMKTGTLCDKAVSLCTGTAFLGHRDFAVPQPRRVVVASAESGKATLLRTLDAVARSRGFADRRSLPKNDSQCLILTTKVPRLSDKAPANNPHYRTEIERFVDELVKYRTDVCFYDPWNLMAGGAVEHADMFATAPLVERVVELCMEAGITVAIVSHAAGRVKTGMRMGLDDVSHTGLQHTARNWFLVSRKVAFRPATPHELYVTTGGSDGHAGSWVVTIDDGSGADGGRRWRTTVQSDTVVEANAAETARRQKSAARTAARNADDNAVRDVVCRLHNNNQQPTETHIVRAEGITVPDEDKPISQARKQAALSRLVQTRQLQRVMEHRQEGRGGDVRVYRPTGCNPPNNTCDAPNDDPEGAESVDGLDG